MAESLFDATEPSGADQQVHLSLAKIRQNCDAAQRLGFGRGAHTIVTNAITLANGRPLDAVITGGGTLDTINNQSEVRNGDKLCLVAEGTSVTLGASGNIAAKTTSVTAGFSVWLRWSATNSKWEEVGGGVPSNVELQSNKGAASGYAGLDSGSKIAATAHPQLPACRATRTTAQSISAGSWVGINMTSEDFDTDAMHDNSTNNTRVTVPSGHAGRWVIAASVGLVAGDGSARAIGIAKNGTLFAFQSGPASAANATWMNVSIIDTPSAGDYYEVKVSHDATAALNTVASAGIFLSAARVS